MLVVASAGAFAVTLPALSHGAASADPGEKSAELQVEATGDEARDAEAAPDAAEAQGDPETQDAAAPDGATGAAGESVPASGGSSSGTAASATSEGPSSAGAPAGAAAGSSGSASSSGTNTSGTSGSGSGHGSDSDAAPSNGSTAADPFSATPSAADEQKFHAFLAGWYGRLGACETEAAAGDSSTCWSGYAAVRDYVRSNVSQWCGAQENLIGAFRCLAWYAESGDESDLAEYRSYKSAVSL